MADSEKLRDNRIGARAAITKRINHIAKLISEKEDRDTVQKKATELEVSLRDLESKCAAYAPHVSEEENTAYLVNAKDAVTQCLQQVGIYIIPSSPDANVQTRHKRPGSVQSNTSKISIRRQLAEAEERATKVKEELLKVKQKYEKAELELKQEKERAALAVQAALERGKMETLKELENEQNLDEDLSSSEHAFPNTLDHPPLGLRRDAEESPSRARDIRAGVNDQSDALLSLIRDSQNQQQRMLTLMNIPKMEMPKFDGDKLKYWTFIQSFESVYELADDKTKLLHLLNACQGKPHDLVSSCMGMEPGEGYQRAKQILDSRYGDEYDVIQSWVKKVTAGNVIKASDGKGLQQFADDLRQCMEVLHSARKVSEMNNQTNLVRLVERLPFHLQSKWRSRARKVKVESHRVPDFEDLVTFVEIASEEINDPVFGWLGDKSHAGKNDHKERKGNKPKTYNTQAMKDDGKNACKLCNLQHALHKCDRFKAMSPEERHEFVKNNKLCFNCLRVGHGYTKCGWKMKCNVNGCGKAHNRLLHRDLRANESPSNNQASENGVNNDPATGGNVTAQHAHVKSVHGAGSSVECLNVVGAGYQCIALPIVPVKVTTVGGHRSFVTYALLDSGSNSSFCSKHLAKKLGLKGKHERLSLSTLTAENAVVDIESVNIKICDVNDVSSPITLNRVYVKPNMHIGKECMAKQVDVDKWPHLKGIELPRVDGCQVHLLIGQDAPQVLIPEEVRKGPEPNSPWAQKTSLGWVLNGPVSGTDNGASSHFTQTSDMTGIDNQLKKLWEMEAPEMAYDMDSRGFSVNDRNVVNLWEKSVKKVDGHYELPIPFKEEPPCLPDNKLTAEKRLNSLKARLTRDQLLRDKYTAEMSKLLDEGYAEKVPENELDRHETGRVNYIPHFAVWNSKKPEKLRVVFDCACKHNNLSLNDKILQGPDLTNGLVGVLLRLRQYPVVIIADIQAMFNRCRVCKNDRDVLRYLWWPDGDLTKPYEIYRMKTHLFGGVWSPSAANFTLKQVAKDEGDKYSPDIADSVRNDFYVDDYVKSVPDVQTAIEMARDVTKLVASGGFRLTKWVSNSRQVLETVSESERADQQACIDLSSHEPESVLGVQWHPETDYLTYDVTVKERKATKRGILSIVNSIYDPLGLVSPFILQAKQLFQELTRLKLAWDDPIPDDLTDQWEKWLDSLNDLRDMKIPRNVTSLGNIVKYELHHFADASLRGIGVTSYLRTCDKDDNVDCVLLYARSKLTPLRPMTVPRLELSAAALAVKIDSMLKRELTVPLSKSTFWTDSTIVLSYIANESKRFQVFVANRVAQIRDKSEPHDWRFIDTRNNISDVGSRGMSARDLIDCKEWLQGPEFLKNKEDEWPRQLALKPLSRDDPELKRDAMTCNATLIGEPSPLAKMWTKHSCFYKVTKMVAWLLKVRKVLLSKARARKRNETITGHNEHTISVHDLRTAEVEIMRQVQQERFADDIKLLKAGKPAAKGSQLRKLDPIICDGLLRVGGRLSNAPYASDFKHPVILPKGHEVVTLIIRQSHERVGHMGTEYTLADTRSKYWIVNGRRSVNKVLRECVKCKMRHGEAGKAKMADLPADRLAPSDFPFSATGVDCFGPVHVKRGRVMVKRYGCLFTCLKSRAVHLEILHALDTDSFIKALTRFVNRRTRPSLLRCDNGSNFVGAYRELSMAMKSLNQNKIESYCLKNDMEWQFNPPLAPHMGGVWERQVKTAKRLLMNLMGEQTLSDEGLLTLSCQVEQIMNSRPLTRISDDVRDYEALTPSHLLLLRPDTDLPVEPTSTQDLYCKKRWKQIRHLSDKFWKRWTREYLTNLQTRSKWNDEYRKFKIGDLVLVADDLCSRGQWPLGRVLECFPGKDGRVRVVKVKTAKGQYVRPITKLCHLEAS